MAKDKTIKKPSANTIIAIISLALLTLETPIIFSLLIAYFSQGWQLTYSTDWSFAIQGISFTLISLGQVITSILLLRPHFTHNAKPPNDYIQLIAILLIPANVVLAIPCFGLFML